MTMTCWSSPVSDDGGESDFAGGPQPAAAPGYSCAICGTKVAALPGPAAAADPGRDAKLAAHRYRPFCSARCKQIDLGEWASEGYRVPSSPPDAPLDEIDYQPPGAGEMPQR